MENAGEFFNIKKSVEYRGYDEFYDGIRWTFHWTVAFRTFSIKDKYENTRFRFLHWGNDR